MKRKINIRMENWLIGSWKEDMLYVVVDIRLCGCFRPSIGLEPLDSCIELQQISICEMSLSFILFR